MDYQKMYTTLFNAITDALSQIETQNYGDVKETLISAQQKQKKSISQHKTKKEVPRRGERSNAAPARSLPPCCRHSRLTIVRRGCV